MIDFEVCANSIHSALAAQRAGAVRVEFCDNLAEGGTTPSFGQIEQARKSISIQLYVIIRPRGGDFLYDDIEFEVMKSDIIRCGKLGCDGVVIGILNADGTIDQVRNHELVKVAKGYGMGVTFHRAFDRCRDRQVALEQIIDIGCERILTSGGRPSALEGAEELRRLNEQANGRIRIQAGAGISASNIAELLRRSGLNEYHGTFRSVCPSRMNYFSSEIQDPDSERRILLSDEEQIRALIRNAKEASSQV